MALKYYFDKIKNWQKTCVVETDEIDEDGERVTYVSDFLSCLVWVSVAVGMSSLTRRNLPEFLRRARIVEGRLGALMTRHGQPYLLREEELRHFIGLRTDGPDLTAKEFERGDLKTLAARPRVALSPTLSIEA
ncbi:MAG: hypothetical protein HY903_21960 [Deltaproteobacteria bacterium]|nr:hypothetical protein [Deltaproteobacteria bacterium]